MTWRSRISREFAVRWWRVGWRIDLLLRAMKCHLSHHALCSLSHYGRRTADTSPSSQCLFPISTYMTYLLLSLVNRISGGSLKYLHWPVSVEHRLLRRLMDGGRTVGQGWDRRAYIAGSCSGSAQHGLSTRRTTTDHGITGRGFQGSCSALN